MLDLIKEKLFHIAAVVAFICAIAGYASWQVDPDMVGVVESKFHNMGAREDGLIERINIAVGDQVEPGQILAKLDVSDLVAEQEQLEQELKNLSDSFKADQTRFELESEKLLLQMKTESSVLGRHIAEYEAKISEVMALDKEINRLQDAENAGLGRTRDLADLMIQRESTRSFIKERKKVLEKNTRSSARPSKKMSREHLEELMISKLGDRLEQIDRVKLGLTIINERMYNRRIVAPCTGYVTAILFRQGDTVKAYDPVVTIEDTDIGYVTAYVPEVIRTNAKNGQAVHVFLKSTGTLGAQGHISFVHPGYSPIPPRLTYRGQEVWARKLRVKLNTPHSLLPGEAVRVSLAGEQYTLTAAKEAQAATSDKTRPAVKMIDIPAQISSITPFEPSGLIWLDDIRQYLVISDDTGMKPHTDHAPMLFLMNPDGSVDPQPVHLKGVTEVNDLEAITQTPEGVVYLVSSQNISKKGKRPASRFQVLKVKRDKRNLEVVGTYPLLPGIVKSLGTEGMKQLGLLALERDGLPVLNIEAACFHNNALYFGLKQPDLANKGIIWKLKNPDTLFTTQNLTKDQLTIEATLELSEHGEPRGISDMLFDNSGNLYLLSTIPKAKTKKQRGLLFKVTQKNGAWSEAEVIQSFDALKPEGICESPDNKLMIVFDEDQATAKFTVLDRDGGT